MSESCKKNILYFLVLAISRICTPFPMLHILGFLQMTESEGKTFFSSLLAKCCSAPAGGIPRAHPPGIQRTCSLVDCFKLQLSQGLPRWLSGKEPPSKAGATGVAGLIIGSGRSPGEGNSNALQCSCQDNPMDRGDWQTTVHWVAKTQTRLSVHKIISNHFVLCVWGEDSVGMHVSWHVHVCFVCPSTILSSIIHLFFSGINPRYPLLLS